MHSFPDTFTIMNGLQYDEVFTAITDLAIFFLMLLPLAVSIGVGYLFLPSSKFVHAQAMFIGATLAVTAVPVAVKVLIDLKMLDSPLGKIMVSAAIFDNIINLMLLAVLTAMMQSGTIPDLSTLMVLAGKILLFFIFTISAGIYILPKLSSLIRISLSEEFEFSVLLMVTFGSAVLAESLGMHFILGAFTAGLFFTRRSMDPQVFEGVQSRVSGITTGFLAPIFFASIGFLHLSAIGVIPLFFFATHHFSGG
jgi:Kef-type K+ transport system membrane component KefB